jgi:8-oxo-dGTP pyrophosphatase MutT (NUDIX family)
LAKEKSCGALVYRWHNDRTQLLIIRHKLGGHWSFPKGHVELGETERQTAMREVKEETGVSIQILEGYRQQVNYSPRPGVSKDVVYFIGYAADSRTVRQVEEVSELRWIDFDRAGDFLTYENDKNLLSRAADYMEKNATRMPGVGA